MIATTTGRNELVDFSFSRYFTLGCREELGFIVARVGGVRTWADQLYEYIMTDTAMYTNHVPMVNRSFT